MRNKIILSVLVCSFLFMSTLTWFSPVEARDSIIGGRIDKDENGNIILVDEDGNPIFADDEQNLPQTGILSSDAMNDYYEEHRPNYFERTTSNLFLGTINWFFKVVGVKDPVELVFQKNPEWLVADEDERDAIEFDMRENKIFGIFPHQLFFYISYFYELVEQFFPIHLVIALCVLGVILMVRGGSQEGRSYVKDLGKGIIVSVLAVRYGYYVWVMSFDLLYWFIDLFFYGMIRLGIEVGPFLSMLWGNGTEGYDAFFSIKTFGNAIILFCAAFMVGMMNWQYALRMIMLSVLFVLFPFVTTASIYPRFRHALDYWWREFINHAALPLAHAIALALYFAIITGFGKGDVSFWVTMAYFFGMPAIAAMVQRMVGLQPEFGNRAMNAAGMMLGLTSIMSMARMLRGRSPGLSANGMDLGGTSPSSGSFNTSGSVAGTGAGASTPSGTAGGGRIGTALSGMMKMGGKALNNRWVHGAVKGTGAVAGGMISMAASGNPMPGAMIGMGAGHLLGRATGKVGSVVQGAGNMIQSGQGLKPSSVWDTAQNRYVAGEGGIISNTAVRMGWGAQRAINMISGGRWGSEAASRSTFIQEQRQQLQTAQMNMQRLEPEKQRAETEYQEMRHKYGPGTEYDRLHRDPQTKKIAMPEEYIRAEQKYHQVSAEYTHWRKQAMDAQMNLTNIDRMKQMQPKMNESLKPLKQQTPYTYGRGRL